MVLNHGGTFNQVPYIFLMTTGITTTLIELTQSSYIWQTLIFQFDSKRVQHICVFASN